MKSFTLIFLIILILFNVLPSLGGLSSSSSGIQELKDKRRDNKNYSSFKNIERNIKFNGERALDVYYDKKTTSELKPVFIFFYGGAWISGDKVKFTKFGSLLETNGYVAVLPNYVLFPKGHLEDMVDDVYKSIQWTFENIKKYGGDPKRVSLAGFSAGSHLTVLTLFKSLFSMENKNKDLTPFPTFEKIVLLNGPYDFDDFSNQLYNVEGVNNTLIERLVKLLFKSPDVSPTDILKSYDDKSLTTLGAKKFIFFYTSKDKEVKESSALNLIYQMKRICPKINIDYVYKEGYEHTTLTRGVRAGKEEEEEVFMSLGIFLIN
eukprot:jgi/Orpsp1_1/1174132/evm.model.c7180000049030.2